ncbi:MAG: alpha/beta hydrolase [Nocardiopsaceae bacterium]|nr:alpha/beta hydrolase [Nocardiopsaceae bacterium]
MDEHPSPADKDPEQQGTTALDSLPIEVDGVPAWWNGLADEERSRLLAEVPAVIAAIDGLPATVRDQANRTVLDRYINRTGDPGARYLRDEIGGADSHPEDRRLLLLFQPPSAPGRTDTLAVISAGDPDRAGNTAVFVPGTGNNLVSRRYLQHSLDFVRRLRDRADAYSDPGSTASIYWLGYKTPDHVAPNAMDSSYAREGHPALTRFLKGLRAAHGGDKPSWTTVIGYSYGSVVAGHAAAADHLAADVLLVTGSPGLGRHITSVHDLNIDPSRVLVAASKADPVVHTPSPVHGKDPADRSFGARLVEVGLIGHLGYRNDRGVAFLNIVYTVCGHLDRVTSPPPMFGNGPAPRLGDQWPRAFAPTKPNLRRSAVGRGTRDPGLLRALWQVARKRPGGRR